MKKDIHPDYHDITVVLTDKTSVPMRSTYGKAGDRLVLDIDPNTHPAWTGGSQHLLDRGGQLSKFNRRYKKFNIKAGSGPSQAPADSGAASGAKSGAASGAKAEG